MLCDVKNLLAKGRNPMKPMTRDIGKNENNQIEKKSYYKLK